MDVGAVYHCLDGIKFLPYRISRAIMKSCKDAYSVDYVTSTRFSITQLRKVSNIPITIFTDVPDKFSDLKCNIITVSYTHLTLPTTPYV